MAKTIEAARSAGTLPTSGQVKGTTVTVPSIQLLLLLLLLVVVVVTFSLRPLVVVQAQDVMQTYTHTDAHQPAAQRKTTANSVQNFG